MEKQATAKAMNAVFTDRLAQRQRWYDDNGFLHISLRFMRTGTLKYAPTPETFVNGVPPDAIGPDGYVTVMVEPADLGEPESLSSLAGMDGLRVHDWANPEKPRDDVGSVAGIPAFDGEYVVGEAVIKDAETIRRLEDGELVEVSAAYVHEIDWTPGEHKGTPYAGKQRRIRYNHFTLLPAGEGRAGSEVRVTNSKEQKLSDKKEGWIGVYSRKLKKLVFAQNADDAEEIAEADAKAENETPSGDGNEGKRQDAEHEKAEVVQGEERKAMIEEMIAKVTALTAERDELVSQLEELKASLEAGISADKIEAEADQMAAEREEAAEVMNSNGIDRQKAMNSFKEKHLRGTALKVFAMNSIREMKKRDPIPEEQASNAIAVNAMWDVVKDSVNVKTAVIGAPLTATAMNADERKTMQEKTLHGLGFRKKK